MPKKVTVYRYTPITNKFEVFDTMYLNTDTSGKEVKYYLEDIDHHHFACSGKEAQPYTTGDIGNGGYVITWLATPDKMVAANILGTSVFDILEETYRYYRNELIKVEGLMTNAHNLGIGYE